MPFQYQCGYLICLIWAHVVPLLSQKEVLGMYLEVLRFSCDHLMPRDRCWRKILTTVKLNMVTVGHIANHLTFLAG